jgi:hypothetical protein
MNWPESIGHTRFPHEERYNSMTCSVTTIVASVNAKYFVFMQTFVYSGREAVSCRAHVRFVDKDDTPNGSGERILVRMIVSR